MLYDLCHNSLNINYIDNFNMEKCDRCNSADLTYNEKYNVWFCNDCHAILSEYNQIETDEDSPNTNIPFESSSVNNSNEES